MTRFFLSTAHPKIAQPLSVHYNHQVSQPVCGQLVENFILLLNHMVYVDHSLHTVHLNVNVPQQLACETTFYDGRGFAEHPCSLLWSVSESPHNS